MLASCHWLVVWDEMQPLRSVRAEERLMRARRTGMVEVFILEVERVTVRVGESGLEAGYERENEAEDEKEVG